MNFEELKAEAKKQGYNLIKASKYPTRLKCPNCNKKPVLWTSCEAKTFHISYIVRCPICQREVIADKKTWAVNRWNDMVEKEVSGNEKS